MNLNKLHKVYFLGIGGIGMSALARYLLAAGIRVYGYDKTPTSLTAALQDEGIDIHFDDSPDLIEPDTDLVILTPAIPATLNEYIYIRQLGLNLMKRSELLGAITSSKTTLAIAGTHGKTTVTTLLSHLLTGSSKGCTSFLGGISKNYNTNLLLNPSSDYMVAEADEFDRSFLRLFPWLAVITSADADHLDIYGGHEELLRSFGDFTANINENGILLIKKGVKVPIRAKAGVKVYTYSLTDPTADFCAGPLSLQNGKYTFNLQLPGNKFIQLNPGLPGLFNVENSIAAAAAAWITGCSETEIEDGISSFSGVRRRFDFRINSRDTVYIDDYAHHPEELNACIRAVRALYPTQRITGIFQPHLYTRTRDFATAFAQSLSKLDCLLLLEIYPARELPIEGISSAILLEKIQIQDKYLVDKQQALEFVRNQHPGLLLTLGAGDIDQLVPEIEKILTINPAK